MNPVRYHGVQHFDSGEKSVLWFGVLRFLETLDQFYHLPAFPRDVEPPPWDDRWFDAKFAKAVTKLRDTWWKLNTAAAHFHRSIEAFRVNYGERDLERFGKALSALEDIPLYLDLLLLYIRIQADCIANVIPNLYGVKGQRNSVPRDSFRHQMVWFLRKRPDFDPEYTTQLRANVQWFSALAGDERGQGLRDIMVHYRGTYQLGWAGIPSRNDFELRAAMVADTRFESEDMLADLKSIMEGYCQFLDMVLTHFWTKLEDVLGGQLMPHTQEYFQIYHFPVSDPRLWIYPVIEPDLGHAWKTGA